MRRAGPVSRRGGAAVRGRVEQPGPAECILTIRAMTLDSSSADLGVAAAFLQTLTSVGTSTLDDLAREIARALGVRAAAILREHEDHPADLLGGHDVFRDDVRLIPSRSEEEEDCVEHHDISVCIHRLPAASRFRTAVVTRFSVGGTDAAFTELHDVAIDRTALDLLRSRVVAQLVSVALEKQRLLERCEIETRRLSCLQRVTAALAATRISDDVANVVVNDAFDLLEASAVVLYRRHPDGEYRLARSRGLGPQGLQKLQVLALSTPLPLARALATGTPVWLESREALVASYPNLVERAASDSGLQAVVALPLSFAGEVVGGLAFSFAGDRRFDRDNKTFLEALADQCAVALQRSNEVEDLLAARERAVAAEARATTLLRAREDFLALAAHELNTPITAMKLLAHRMKREENPAAPTVSRLVDRLQRLVEAFFAHAELDRNDDVELECAEMDLRDLIVDAVKARREALDHSGIQIGVRGSSIVGAWDGRRVRLAIDSVVSNATRYGGGAPIDIELREEGDVAVVVVRDGGPGLGPEPAALLERYARGDESAGRGGLGLGLWIAREYIALHGGHISVMTDAHGTAVQLELPMVPRPRSIAQHPAHPR